MYKDTREKSREAGTKKVYTEAFVRPGDNIFRERKTAVKTRNISGFDTYDMVEGPSEKKVNAARLMLWVG